MKTLPILMALVTVASLSSLSARGQILWDKSSPQPISGVSDIAMNGAYVDALKASSAGTQIAEKIGDTTFNLVTSGDTTITLTGATDTSGTEGSASTASTAYNNVLSDCAFVFAGDTGTINLNNLVTGNVYQVEIWNSDSRDTIVAGVTSIDLPGNDWAVGMFTATGATQSFDFTNNPASLFGVISAVALRDVSVPEPSTYAMMLGGLALLGFCLRRKGALPGSMFSVQTNNES
jgi:hypothetical protein